MEYQDLKELVESGALNLEKDEKKIMTLKDYTKSDGTTCDYLVEVWGDGKALLDFLSDAAIKTVGNITKIDGVTQEEWDQAVEEMKEEWGGSNKPKAKKKAKKKVTPKVAIDPRLPLTTTVVTEDGEPDLKKAFEQGKIYLNNCRVVKTTYYSEQPEKKATNHRSGLTKAKAFLRNVSPTNSYRSNFIVCGNVGSIEVQK
jgi:hypothetical protein